MGCCFSTSKSVDLPPVPPANKQPRQQPTPGSGSRGGVANEALEKD
ncbi:uncharacterized protein Dwil_GK27727 [Drosophila willistoni]|uniref:Uncharacterized protein n=1 Tax=Drosophila willistoni TaxID=7260 RepID=A0A0Q9X4Z0_DROWI|nr:uncharacterized protein Dwil_GK27727 [Drosophila willistoni]